MNPIVPDSNDHPGDCNNTSGVVAGGVAAPRAAGVVPEAAVTGVGEISSVVAGAATSPSADGTAAVAAGDASGRDVVADIPGVHGVILMGAGNIAAAFGFYPESVHHVVFGAAAPGDVHGHRLSSGGGGVNLAFSPGGGASLQGHRIYLSLRWIQFFQTILLSQFCLLPLSLFPLLLAVDFSSQFIFPRPPCCPGSTCHSSPCCWWWNFSSRPSVSKPS